MRTKTQSVMVELSPEILANPEYRLEPIWTVREAQCALERCADYFEVADEERERHPKLITQRLMEAMIRAELELRRLDRFKIQMRA